MSIAKMNKVTIIGTKDKEEEILKKLMKQGFFQIEDMSHLVEDEEFKEIFNKEEKNDEISKINQKLVKIEKAIKEVVPQDKQEDFTRMIEDHSDSVEYSGFVAGFRIAAKLWREL